MSGFTKEIIAKTFTELLDEKPMSKITVKDIVERCGVNRNTFYYHFKDIPDVVEFILKKKWDEILEHPQDRASILECMEEMADLVRNNRKVMFNVYRSVKKDTFLFYMNEISNYIIMEYFRKNADQFDLDEGEIRILIQYYKCLFMGFLMEWLEREDFFSHRDIVWSVLQCGLIQQLLKRDIRPYRDYMRLVPVACLERGLGRVCKSLDSFQKRIMI